jgi:hypothetical protein
MGMRWPRGRRGPSARPVGSPRGVQTVDSVVAAGVFPRYRPGRCCGRLTGPPGPLEVPVAAGDALNGLSHARFPPKRGIRLACRPLGAASSRAAPPASVYRRNGRAEGRRVAGKGPGRPPGLRRGPRCQLRAGERPARGRRGRQGSGAPVEGRRAAGKGPARPSGLRRGPRCQLRAGERPALIRSDRDAAHSRFSGLSQAG